MTKRKYDAYTLWVNWRNLGWQPAFTINQGVHWSPIEIIEDWLEARGYYDNPRSYWQRGKTWMIKPDGQMPANAIRERGTNQ